MNKGIVLLLSLVTFGCEFTTEVVPSTVQKNTPFEVKFKLATDYPFGSGSFEAATLCAYLPKDWKILNVEYKAANPNLFATNVPSSEVKFNEQNDPRQKFLISRKLKQTCFATEKMSFSPYSHGKVKVTLQARKTGKKKIHFVAGSNRRPSNDHTKLEIRVQ